MFTRKSLYWKYIRTIVIIFLLAFTLFGGIVITQTVSMIEDTKEKQLIAGSRSVISILNEQVNKTYWQIYGASIGDLLNYGNFSYTLKVILNNNDSDLIVANDQGQIVYSAVKNYSDDLLANKMKIKDDVRNDIDSSTEMKLITTLSELTELTDDSVSADVKSYLNEKKHIMIVPVKLVKKMYYEVSSEEKFGYIFITTDIGDISQAKSSVLKSMLIAAGVILLLIFVVVGVWTYRTVKPLHQMVLATQSFAQGDFSVRVDVDSEDEIGQLSLSFNKMADSLATSEGVRRNFVANVSHELKTPMTTIAGFINGILDGTIPKEKQANYLTIVSNEIRRLSRLVESMLSLSRIDSGELKLRQESFNISSTIFNTLLTFENNIESKKIDIRGLESIPDIILVGDPDMIHQVIYNLIENAVKFVNEGGYIEVKTLDTYDKCIVKITNSGHGIDENEIKHIFEKFYKTDKSRSIDKKGMGLGLYIVKTILRLHGGDITAHSVIDEYTSFEFYIPKKEDKTKHLSKAPGKSDTSQEEDK